MPLVLVNGCFDCLHVGHVRLLEWSSQYGDVWVAINSDASIRRLKGRGRPIYTEDERREILLALRCVTDVWIFGEDTPAVIISMLNPDVVIVGHDHSLADPHYAAAASRGVVLHQGPRFADRSTSDVIRRMAPNGRKHAFADRSGPGSV